MTKNKKQKKRDERIIGYAQKMRKSFKKVVWRKQNELFKKMLHLCRKYKENWDFFFRTHGKNNYHFYRGARSNWFFFSQKWLSRKIVKMFSDWRHFGPIKNLQVSIRIKKRNILWMHINWKKQVNHFHNVLSHYNFLKCHIICSNSNKVKFALCEIHAIWSYKQFS